MKYKLVKKRNPAKENQPRTWHPNIIKLGKITHKRLIIQTYKEAGVKRNDATKLINGFFDEIPNYLMEGYSVQLGDMGTFRLSVSSGGTLNPDDYTTDKIKAIRVIFTPSIQLKDKLSNIEFERVE